MNQWRNFNIEIETKITTKRRSRQYTRTVYYIILIYEIIKIY